MQRILSPSMLSADFAELKQDLLAIEKAGATYLHIDVMDGLFVPQISFGMPVIQSIRPVSNLFFDVHLMIEEPMRYLEAFANSGADLITVHLEACKDVRATLEKIKSLGKKVGLSIKPGTPVEAMRPYLELLDLILIMSVEPGFGGQSYIPASTEKIKETRALIQESGFPIDLEVDGGIKQNNVEEVLQAGANVIVAGSAVFGKDTERSCKEMLEKMGL